MTTTGQLIARARQNTGLSQRQLGDRLGVTQAAVAHWEHGRRAIYVVRLAQVAAVTGVRTFALIGDQP
jgi:transcriptional regulator with XRE-family HTH domain